MKSKERGQALAETALFAMLAVIMAFGLLAWIPTHRARTAATEAAYACSQFLSQSPDPAHARSNAVNVAWQTLNADWSATAGVQYLVLSYPIYCSRWHRLKLICAVFVVQFGVETFLTQIESLYFNRALQIATSEIFGIVTAGTIRALIFAPLALWFLGGMKTSSGIEVNVPSIKSQGWKWRFTGLTILYPIVYFLVGYYVTWQWEETRLFYSGTKDILPFFTHFRENFASDLYFIPFQKKGTESKNSFRGLITTGNG